MFSEEINNIRRATAVFYTPLLSQTLLFYFFLWMFFSKIAFPSITYPKNLQHYFKLLEKCSYSYTTHLLHKHR